MIQNILNKMVGSSLSGMLMGYDEFLATNTMDMPISRNFATLALIPLLRSWIKHGFYGAKKREQEKKLSPRHRKNLETILAKNGLSSKKIKEIINFVESNADAE